MADGVDFDFYPGNHNKTLLVSFSPVNQPAGKYMLFGKFRGSGLPCLFFSNPGNDWYQAGLRHVFDEIIRVRAQVQPGRIIFWGYSMGAYAALAAGAACSSADDIVVAISPDFIVGAPETMSSLNAQSFDHDYCDLMSHLENITARTEIFVPCFSLRDGINVRLLREVKNPLIKKHFVAHSHFIQPHFSETGMLEKLISSILEGTEFEPAGGLPADKQEIDIAVASYQLLLRQKEVKHSDFALVEDSSSENYEWFHFKSRILMNLGFLDEALACARISVKICQTNPFFFEHLGKVLLRHALRNCDEAVLNLEQAISISGSSGKARFQATAERYKRLQASLHVDSR